jgi:hypothetical protein
LSQAVRINSGVRTDQTGVRLRLETKRQNQLLVPAKVYREFYKALFELYETRSWPKDIEELGLLNILQYENIKRSDTSDKPLNSTSAGGGQQ